VSASVTSVGVSFSAGSNSACTSTGNGSSVVIVAQWETGADPSLICVTSVMTITFYSPSGVLPPLSISPAGLTHSTAIVVTSVQVSTAGTKEDTVCNNRGRCGAFVWSKNSGD